MTTLNELNEAVGYLRREGCTRAVNTGLWFRVQTGVTLASDPLIAADELRRELESTRCASRFSLALHTRPYGARLDDSR